jgi:predicted DNA-binding protein
MSGNVLTSLSIPVDEYEALKKIASDRGKTMKEIIREALAESHKGYKTAMKKKEGGDDT